MVNFTLNPTNLQFEEPEGLIMESKVRDPLHDTIPFTKAEKWIIDRPEFQRLRKIQQTAFIKYVFPGATHTRFEHSLGVMHLSGIFWNRLHQNQQRLLEAVDQDLAKVPKLVRTGYEITSALHGSISETKNALKQFNEPLILQTLRFAALLHDVGHAPFSHSSERFMPTWASLEAQLDDLNLKDYLKIAFQKKFARYRAVSTGHMSRRVRHEVYTLMIVSEVFGHSDPFLNDEMGQNVCAVLDTDVESKGVLLESGLASLMHEVVSGELDVDRMDYLLRDSRECGVVYGLFDVGRLLDSAAFYFQHSSKKYHLAIRKSGVAAFEDYLRARWSMYQQVYFHKTATACEAMLEALRKCCKSYCLPFKVTEYLKINDHTFPLILRNEVANLQFENDKSLGLELCDDLFENRKLWKRIYEETFPQELVNQIPSLCPSVMGLLAEKKMACEMIESRTSLTRFAPKGRSESSENSLRVIIKDLFGFSYLEPIENHSPLVNQTSDEISIRRIFVKIKDNSPELVRELKHEISSALTYRGGDDD